MTAAQVDLFGEPDRVGKYKVHPIAGMFPLLDENSQEWFDLVSSIKYSGQIDPIIVDGDTLIDGRNRLRACEKLKREPLVREWSTLGVGVSQSVWIEAKNLDRRHLTPDQRAAIAAKIMGWKLEHEAEEAKKAAQFQPGNKAASETADPKSGPPSRDIKKKQANSTAGKIAAKAGVSRYKAEQAIKVQKEDPEAAERVIRGEVKLSEAVKAEKPEDDQADQFLKIRGRREKLSLSTLKKAWQGTKPKHRSKFAEWLRENKLTYYREWMALTILEDKPSDCADGWERFRALMIQVTEAADALEGLEVDVQHIIPARDAAAKVIKKLEKILGNLREE